MVFYSAFNSISVISRRQLTLLMFFLGFTSTRLGSEVSCPRTIPRKNPEDPVRLEPRTPGLGVKHFNTEPWGTHIFSLYESKNDCSSTLAKYKNRRVQIGTICRRQCKSYTKYEICSY